jgi:hypothetical protein
MAFLYKFDMTPMRSQTYEDLLIKLEAAGMEAPPGRLCHVTYGDPDQLRVIDVWDSSQNFHAFADHLGAAKADLGVILHEPDVSPIYDVVASDRLASVARPPNTFLVTFEPPGLDNRQLAAIANRLDEWGSGDPPERLYHFSYRENDCLHVVEIWEGEDAFHDYLNQVDRARRELGLEAIPRENLQIDPVHRVIIWP